MQKENGTLLNSIKIEPSHPAKHSVIWLHGLGADGEDFVPIVPQLKLPAQLGVRFIFPHAPVIPVTINNGYEMRAWYDIYSMSIDSKIDAKGIDNSKLLIEKLIANELADGIAAKNIILAGFSQGAVMALTIGLNYSQPLAGIIALSGYLPKIPPESNQPIPIFIAHGTEDLIVPFALGKAAAVNLQQANYPISWHSYPMGHSVCAQEIQDLGEWMRDIYSNQK